MSHCGTVGTVSFGIAHRAGLCKAFWENPKNSRSNSHLLLMSTSRVFPSPKSRLRTGVHPFLQLDVNALHLHEARKQKISSARHDHAPAALSACMLCTARCVRHTVQHSQYWPQNCNNNSTKIYYTTVQYCTVHYTAYTTASWHFWTIQYLRYHCYCTVQAGDCH